MKIIIYSLVITVMLHSVSSAQPLRKCATSEKFTQQLADDPSFAKIHKEIEKFTSEYVQRGGSSNVSLQKGTALYTIPVVVHIIYKTAAQNISDAQVRSQIESLNRDFQLNNPDAGSVPAAFSSLVADCKIQFCLAQRDPNGNATNGIVRKSTTKSSFTTDDQMKFSAKGGDDIWNRNEYLNLWVCNLSGGILGYAQFPGGPASTDGVVITTTAFGSSGTAAAPFNLGRTATHEVGHWLNLFHIWGDDGSSCTGSDQVGDTPNQADPNYGCPGYPVVSCSNGPNGDMFMNYMDYVDDACMYMFTEGQRTRMYGVLQAEGARASLATSQGCVAPTGTVCPTPGSVTAAGITQTSATVSWTSVPGSSSYSLQYKTTAGATFTTVSVSSVSFNLTGLTAGTGYDYQVKANCASAGSNYSALKSFVTLSAGCTDALEPNNTSAEAALIAVNANTTASISTNQDKDYFKFSNTSAQKNIKISLTNLPADYDVRLYNPSGTQVGISQNGSTTSESITYNGGAIGVYKVYVYGYGAAYSSSKCYTLTALVSGTAFREDERVTNQQNIVKLSPVPASGVVTIMMGASEKAAGEIIVTNGMGSIVLRKKTMFNEGVNNEKLDASKWTNGLYFIKIQQGKSIQTEKLIVHH